MTAFEALCTDNFHDYAAYAMSVQQQLSPTVERLSGSLPCPALLSLVGSSFSRLNAAVKPFPFPLAFFTCAAYLDLAPRGSTSIDSHWKRANTHTHIYVNTHNAAWGYQNGNEHGISFNFLFQHIRECGHKAYFVRLFGLGPSCFSLYEIVPQRWLLLCSLAIFW